MSNLASERVLPPLATARSSSSSRCAWIALAISLRRAPRWAAFAARVSERSREVEAVARYPGERLLGRGVDERLWRACSFDPAAVQVAAQGFHGGLRLFLLPTSIAEASGFPGMH